MVYKYKCSDCNATYIGKTKRHSKTRFSEHLGISALTGKTVKTEKDSAVRDHHSICRSTADLKSFTVLARDSNNWTLLLKESLFIQKERPQLNAKIASVPLKLFLDSPGGFNNFLIVYKILMRMFLY